MSWAEIKKAINSDLSVPLNEQLNSKTTYFKGSKYVIRTGRGETANDVVDVRNHGKLLYAFIGNPYSSTAGYIQIDDDYIYGAANKTSPIVCPKDFINGVSNSGAAQWLAVPAMPSTEIRMGLCVVNEFNGYTIENAVTDNTNTYFVVRLKGYIIDEPIEFEKLIIHTAGGSGVPNPWCVIYALLD